MPTKKKPNKKKVKANREDYLIQVNADRAGKFKYTAKGKDASRFAPKLGDTISWEVRFGGKKTAFQIEFPGIAPFQGARVLRSSSKKTPPQTVALLPHYQGNLIFKYTVTLSNGWYDDPIIGPVPADPLVDDLAGRVILLSADDNGNLTITPPPMPLAVGAVAWQWDPQSAYTDDFVLTFDAPVVPGWPPVTNSQGQSIVLNLQSAGDDGYTINTVNTGLSGDSALAIE